MYLKYVISDKQIPILEQYIGNGIRFGNTVVVISTEHKRIVNDERAR